MATLAEQLESVQEAIARIEEGAQSITNKGKTTNYAQLNVLYERERDLLARIDAESRGRIIVAET